MILLSSRVTRTPETWLRRCRFSPKPRNSLLALILDLSVYVPGPLPFFVDFIVVHLKNMRWLKNKLFFGNLTPGALEQFKCHKKSRSRQSRRVR